MILILSIFLAEIDVDELVKNYGIAHQLFLQKEYIEAERYFSQLARRYRNSEFWYEIEYRLAECRFNLGRFHQARGDFSRLLNDPGLPKYLRPEVLYALGITAIILKDFKTAQDVLHRLVKNPAYQNEARANFAIGVFYYFQGRYKEALSKLKDNPILEAKFYLGKTYSRLHQPMEAIKAFKEITNEAPNTHLANLAIFSAGQALFENQDYTGARIKLDYFVNHFPQSPLFDYAQYFLAAALYHTGEFAKALEKLIPLTKNPDNLLAAHAGYFVGLCKSALNQPQDAVNHFQRVRANFPNAAIASYANLQLIWSQLEAGDYTAAILASSQLASMFRTGELASVGDYISGYLLYKTNHLNEAAQHFLNVLKTYPRSSLREPACASYLMIQNKMKNYRISVSFGSKYLKDYPESDTPWRRRIYYYLADANYYLGRYSNADEFYRKIGGAEELSELTPYASLGLGYCLIHQGRYPEAITALKPLSDGLPNDSTFTIAAQLGLGYAYFNNGEYLKALDLFESCYNRFPSDERVIERSLFYSGLCYYYKEYYGQAIEKWERLINTRPRAKLSAEAGFRTGDTYFKALKYDRAIAIFRWVVEFHPASEWASASQLATAQAFYNQKKFDDAIREYQKFLDLYVTDPMAENARKGLAMCYYRKGLKDTLAMKEFVERFPQSELAADAQFKMGRDLFDEKRFKEAAIEFEKVVINFPKSGSATDALLMAAECYVNLKEWDKATDAYERFIRYFPDHPTTPAAHFNLATVYYNAGRFDKAVEHFKVVADSFPDSEYAENAAYNVSVCYRKLGFESKALRALDTYAKKGGNQEALAMEKAKILYGKGDYNGVITTLSKIMPADVKKRAEVLFYLGEAYRNIGNKPKAIGYYRQLLGLNLIDDPFVLKGLSQWAIILENEKKNTQAIKIYRGIIAATTREDVKQAARNRINYLKGG
ncbi:MAG TPA: tetratricopeptide repeat protein [bacterium (Candidatus Stahlbacteria)]|nr:tetratricopeptide repeat protein [Candidatus Stahlbacteria bacterium]